MNLAIMVGNVCRDAEVKKSKSDFTTFTLACNEGKDECNFIPCVAFGKTGEIAAKYLKKGKKVLLQGRFTSRKSGDKTYYGLTINSITFLDSAESTKKETSSETSENSNPFA